MGAKDSVQAIFDRIDDLGYAAMDFLTGKGKGEDEAKDPAGAGEVSPSFSPYAMASEPYNPISAEMASMAGNSINPEVAAMTMAQGGAIEADRANYGEFASQAFAGVSQQQGAGMAYG